MKFYFTKTYIFIQKLFPRLIWKIQNPEVKTVYITFDDGPIPEVTPWVLEQLEKFNAKATFFCIGDNIKKNPEIFKQVLNNGHSIGNHTFNHLNGWNFDTDEYVRNTQLCTREIEKHTILPHKLFRPPYGKITKKQQQALLNQGFKIVMWEVLSADFDQTITPEQCLKNVLDNVQNGSIIIFHDSLKAEKNLRYALPKALEYLKNNNFECSKI